MTQTEDFRSAVLEALTSAPPATGRSHDYSRGNVWSHACYYRSHDDGLRINGDMFANRVMPGDWLILPNGEKTTRYRITEAKWLGDPRDMWRFKAIFDPRSE